MGTKRTGSCGQAANGSWGEPGAVDALQTRYKHSCSTLYNGRSNAAGPSLRVRGSVLGDPPVREAENMVTEGLAGRRGARLGAEIARGRVVVAASGRRVPHVTVKLTVGDAGNRKL